MNYKDFKLNIAKAGLTIKEFSELLDMHPNSITNLKQKDSIPKHLVIIVLLMVELKNHNIAYSKLITKWRNDERKNFRNQ